MIKIGNILILNGDSKDDLSIYENTRMCLISCGFSHRSTITASSIGEAGFPYCRQREIKTLRGEYVAPQEFNIAWSKKHEDIYPYLAIVTLLLVSGCPVEIFKLLKF